MEFNKRLEMIRNTLVAISNVFDRGTSKEIDSEIPSGDEIFGNQLGDITS